MLKGKGLSAVSLKITNPLGEVIGPNAES